MLVDPIQAISVPFSVQDDQHVVYCHKSLLFNEDFVPPDTQVPPCRGALLSPNTHNAMVEIALTGGATSQPNMPTQEEEATRKC